MDGEQSVHLGFKHIVRTGDGDGGCSCSIEGGKGSAGPVDGVGSRFSFFGFRNLCNAVGTHLNGYAGAVAGVAFIHISVAGDGEGFGVVFVWFVRSPCGGGSSLAGDGDGVVGIASANAGNLFIGTQNHGSVVVGSNHSLRRYRCNFVAPHNAVGDACFIGEQLGFAGVADGERAAGFLEGQHCLGIDIVECVVVVTAYNLNRGAWRNHNFVTR